MVMSARLPTESVPVRKLRPKAFAPSAVAKLNMSRIGMSFGRPPSRRALSASSWWSERISARICINRSDGIRVSLSTENDGRKP